MRRGIGNATGMRLSDAIGHRAPDTVRLRVADRVADAKSLCRPVRLRPALRCRMTVRERAGKGVAVCCSLGI